VADSEAELNAKWPVILSHRPDFIKAMLAFSEDHERYEKDPSAVPPLDGRTARKGVNPRLLPRVVERAHASGLRVSAHVNTATDFRNAMAAGVDEINHLPPRRSATLAEDTGLTAEDAREVARRGIVVVSTLALPANIPDTIRTVLRPRQQTTLRLMVDAGVRLAIGTDNPDDTSVQEAVYIRELGVLDDLAVLKMWVEATPATIFPTRRIGYLREGFEASFLALSGNPLAEFQNVRRITLRVKQGRIVVP
jgi:imidazolonepropionase-like amidohydrolase